MKYIDEFRDVVLDHPEAGVALEMAQVGGGSRDQIVDGKDFPPAIDEKVAQMRAQESRAARDYRAH